MKIDVNQMTDFEKAIHDHNLQGMQHIQVLTDQVDIEKGGIGSGRRALSYLIDNRSKLPSASHIMKKRHYGTTSFDLGEKRDDRSFHIEGHRLTVKGDETKEDKHLVLHEHKGRILKHSYLIPKEYHRVLIGKDYSEHTIQKADKDWAPHNVLGKTSSGKAVYEDHTHPDNYGSDFSTQDHKDASKIHFNHAKSYPEHSLYKRAHKGIAKLHKLESEESGSSVGKTMFTITNKLMNKTIQKAGGTHGWIDGKTSSGKNIRGGNVNHPDHSMYTAQDHLDAAKHWKNRIAEARQAPSGVKDFKGMDTFRKFHQKAAIVKMRQNSIQKGMFVSDGVSSKGIKNWAVISAKVSLKGKMKRENIGGAKYKGVHKESGLHEYAVYHKNDMNKPHHSVFLSDHGHSFTQGKLKKSNDSNFQKAGEGGIVIGRTYSGKTVFNHRNPDAGHKFDGWNKQDHLDAASSHEHIKAEHDKLKKLDTKRLKDIHKQNFRVASQDGVDKHTLIGDLLESKFGREKLKEYDAKNSSQKKSSEVKPDTKSTPAELFAKHGLSDGISHVKQGKRSTVFDTQRSESLSKNEHLIEALRHVDKLKKKYDVTVKDASSNFEPSREEINNEREWSRGHSKGAVIHVHEKGNPKNHVASFDFQAWGGGNKHLSALKKLLDSPEDK